MGSIFREDKIDILNKQAQAELGEFFLEGIDELGLKYREGQEEYASDVMKAIRFKEILLIQAGVGVGKSFGYLLPIFFTMKNNEYFKKVIISTFSIALQEQLFNDIKRLSEMLGISIKVAVAKGINNYACLYKIRDRLAKKTFLSKEEVRQLEAIEAEIKRINSADKADLESFSKDIWEKIKLKNRGVCSNCTYKRECQYYRVATDVETASIVITNHANIATNAVNSESNLLDNTDMFVFDEAHNLSDLIRSVGGFELDCQKIIGWADDVRDAIKYEFGANSIMRRNESIGDNIRLNIALKNLFYRIRENAKINNRNDYKVSEVNRMWFNLTPKVLEQLEIVIDELTKLLREVSKYEERYKKRIIPNIVRELNQALKYFKDMKEKNSKNIFGVNFITDERISIVGGPKECSEVINKIFASKVPVLFTSGTMYYEGYGNFIDALNISSAQPQSQIVFSEPIPSSYDYKNNTLFYYSNDVASPNDDTEEYIISLASEVEEMIKATDGKTLVLFTSKKIMKAVYDLISANTNFPYKLLLQSDTNASKIKEEFANDTNSCLFATGSFWEGIDIKGSSLSNVIITKLPFSQVDAVSKFKASGLYPDLAMKKVYIPDMLMKLKQGFGRLIRTETDKGVVICLDQRTAKYLDEIKKVLPKDIVITNNKTQLYAFIDANNIKGITR